MDARDERAARIVAPHARGESGSDQARRAHGARAGAADLRARSMHRMRLLRRRLRNRAHAQGLRRRRGLEQDRAFRLDPRDTRGDAEFYELVGDDNGVFGCMSLLACHDVCPKQLPLARRSHSFAGRWCDRASSSRAGLGRVKTSHRRTRLRVLGLHFAKPCEECRFPISNQQPSSDFQMGNRVSSAFNSINCCAPPQIDDASSIDSKP